MGSLARRSNRCCGLDDEGQDRVGALEPALALLFFDQVEVEEVGVQVEVILDGPRVRQTNGPAFAAGPLVFVRKQFLLNQKLGNHLPI